MIAILSLMTPAFATCAPSVPQGLYPSDGAVDVPVDAHLVVLHSGGCGAYGGVLTLSTGGATVLEVTDPMQTWFNGASLYEEALAGGLLPETTYEAEFASVDGEVLQSTFTTGTATASQDVAPPDVSASVSFAEWQGPRVLAYVEVTLSELAPDHFGLASADAVDATTLAAPDAAGTATSTVFVLVDPEDAEVCAEGAQRDLAGNQSDWVAACTDFEAPAPPVQRPLDDRDGGPFSCSTAPSHALGWLALLALPLLGVRRGGRRGQARHAVVKVWGSRSMW